VKCPNPFPPHLEQQAQAQRIVVVGANMSNKKGREIQDLHCHPRMSTKYDRTLLEYDLAGKYAGDCDDHQRNGKGKGELNFRLYRCIVADNCGFQKKCEKYWPDSGKSERWGHANVKCLSESSTADYTLRELLLSWRNREERRVYQYHFLVWPDHGVPSDPGCVLNFLQDVNSRQEHIMLEGVQPVSFSQKNFHKRFKIEESSTTAIFCENILILVQ
jgi:Protein-tyrosine phosphatase